MSNREEAMRKLNPRQRKLAEDYETFHKEMMADPEKMRKWENVMLLLEDYFHLLKELNLPTDLVVQDLKKTWTKNIFKGHTKSADEFEEVLHKLIALRQ